MNHFNHRFRPWSTPSNGPDADDLDDFLNGRAVCDGPTDINGTHDPASLVTSARVFHQRLEAAQESHPGAGYPEPALWDHIVGEHEKERGMSATVGDVNQRYVEVSAVPSTSGLPGRRRWLDSRIVNFAATALLVLAIGAGYWFSGFGPGGGGSGDDSLRFAAQGVTPVGSPESAAVGCSVEPLTVDEVMAIVRNPISAMEVSDDIPVASPDSLVEIGRPMISLPEPGQDVSYPSREEFTSFMELSTTYYDCLLAGTNFQFWSLLSPNVLQSQILSEFPVYRDEDSIREWVQRVGVQPASSQPPQVVSDLGDRWMHEYRLIPNPDQEAAVIVEPVWEYDARFAWIGTQVVHVESGEMVSAAGASPDFRVTHGDRAEVLVLVQWAGTDEWFVLGPATVVRI